VRHLKQKPGHPKINIKKEKNFRRRKVSSNTPRFTINPPRFHHELTITKHPKTQKTPAKTPFHHAEKNLLQLSPNFVR
jgi:hypothetical protein